MKNQIPPWELFWLRPAGSFCEGEPPEKFGSFKLPRAGALNMHQGGFVPAEIKNQQRVNHPSPTSNPSMYRVDPTTSPQVQMRGEGFRGTEQVQTLFHQTTPSRLEEPKQLTSIQCQTESSLEFVSVCRVPEAPFGLIAEAILSGLPVKALVDTGATINLIRSEVYHNLTTAPPLRPYKGTLETADGRQVGVEGWVTANLELGSIDDEVEALVVPELKAEMIIGLRSLKEHECSLDFQCDNLWTGRKEGSIVPLQYEILKVTSYPKHPPEDDNYWDVNSSHSTPLTEPHTPLGGSNVESSYAMGDVVEGLPPVSQDHEVQGMQEEGSMDFQV